MSGTHGVFQHRTGYFYTILEEDFCEMYKADGVNEVCRAYITSILETLTNKQYDATGKDTDIWVYMSLPEMERRMRKACSQRTIHKEVQGMIKDGYLEKRRAIGKATMEYRLNLKKIREQLLSLPEKQPCNSATSNLANLQEPSSNSATLTLQNDNIHLANLQPRITREETKNTEEQEERENPPAHRDASASAHTPSASSSEQKLQQIIEDKTANGVGSPPAPSKEATNGQEVIQANVPGAHKRTRRQKPEIDAQTQKRIEDVYTYLDKLKREVLGDDTEAYQRTKRGTDAILAILPLKPTDRKMRKVFFDMWDEKDRNGDHFWRKRMKPHNICSEYESRLIGLEGKTPTNEHKASDAANVNSDNPFQAFKARVAARQAQEVQA